jgi:hypothetical protein
MELNKGFSSALILLSISSLRLRRPIISPSSPQAEMKTTNSMNGRLVNPYINLNICIYLKTSLKARRIRIRLRRYKLDYDYKFYDFRLND